MADYFVDHGAYAAQGVIGAANPTTWAVPQEGDGSATTAAAASAVASILFNAVPTTGAFTICGLSPSVTGVLSAASVDAAANTLATNINAVTTAVAAGVAGGLPALKNLVFARGPAGGAPAGTCQIMMRVGSAALNHANNSNVAIAHTFNGTAPTLTQFIGGTGGCWGWFISDVTVGGASATYAAGAFGVFSTAKPFVSVPSGGSTLLEPSHTTDEVWLRSGAGQTITLPVNTFINAGSTLQSNIILDTNTKWTGDSGSGVFTVSFAANSTSSAVFTMNSAVTPKSLGALLRNALVFHFRSSSGSTALPIECANGGGYAFSKIWNVKFSEASNIPEAQGFYIRGNGFTHYLWQNCTFAYSAPRTVTTYALVSLTLTGVVLFDGCRWEYNHTGVTSPAPAVSGSLAAVRAEVRLTNCSYVDAGGKKILPFSITSPSNGNLICENCTGFRLDSGTYVGLPNTNLSNDEYTGRSVVKLAEVGLSFRDESSRGVCDWVYGANYPTLRAVQPDGTVWSLKMDWITTAGVVAEYRPFRSIPMQQIYREAAATKTVTLEVLVPDAATLNSLIAVMRVGYISNTTGQMMEEWTKGKASAYSASAASWTLNGTTNYSAKKFTLTTSEPIKQNTAITVFFEFHRPPASANRQIYVDPEFALT